MNSDINQFFAQFNTTESYRILAFLFVAFLLGMWVGRLTRRAKIRRLEKELEAKKKELAELQAELAPLREELDLKKADLKKVSFENEELEAKVQRLEADKVKLYNEIHSINTDLEQLQSTNNTYLSNIEDLQAQIIGLKQQNESLSEESTTSEDEAVDNLAQMQSVYNATRNRLEALEEKLDNLAQENDTLKVEVNSLKERPIYTESTPLARSASKVEEEEESEPPLEINFGKDKEVMGNKIFVEEEQTADDLTRINVIGPFLEQQLNQIGISTYEQISQFDQTTIDEVTKAIGYFPGRIEKDDWVGQARHLHELKLANPDAFKAPVVIDEKLDDLKLVEGIGPKIEQILKEAGIRNLSELAEADEDNLRSLLAAAGDRFRMHDPGTWPAQARLAANGNWELLNEYQEQLKGGREVDSDDGDS